MKLKYQMRGLGIGMVVTALLMGVATKEDLPLSDAEIRARAIELGMVDSGNLSLRDVQGSAADPTAPPVSDPTEVSGNEGESGRRQEEDNGSDGLESEGDNPSDGLESEGDSPSDDLGAEGAAADGESENSKAGAESAGTQRDKVVVVIESGITSDAVSRMLAQSGLIKDAGEFDSYLCDNGYSVKIHAGTYEINLGTSEEEIVKIITKSR